MTEKPLKVGDEVILRGKVTKVFEAEKTGLQRVAMRIPQLDIPVNMYAMYIDEADVRRKEVQ